MRNVSKNLFMALTVVCAVALVVFLIQLIVINRDVESISPDSVVSGGPSGEESDPDSEDGPDDPADAEDFNQELQTPRPPPQGTQRLINVSDTSTLVIYVDEDKFE